MHIYCREKRHVLLLLYMSFDLDQGPHIHHQRLLLLL